MLKRILLLWLGVCSVAVAAVDSDFLIHDYTVGRVSTDMSPLEASKQYPAERVKWWDPYPRIHVIDIDPTADPSKPPPIRMNLDQDQKHIWLIVISDKRYHTAKGISIGSTFGALRKAYPNLNIHPEEGEMDRAIVAEIQGEGIACVLAYDDLTWDKIRLIPNASRSGVPASIIPDDKLIQSISVIQRETSPPAPSDSAE